MVKKWGLLSLAALGLLFALALWWRLPKFQVVNNLPFKQFRLSTLGGNLFLWNSGYWPQVKRVTVIYTPESQKGYGLSAPDGTEVVSLWMENQQGHLSLYIHYGQEKFVDIADTPGWFDRDVYTAICLMLEGKALSWEGCHQKAADYYQWLLQNKLPGIIKQGKGLFGFQLVKPAYAACSGTIICGKEVWVKSCVGGINNGFTCADNIDCPGKKPDGSPATCNGSWKCDLSEGSNLNCNAIPDQWNCNNNSKADRCAIGCNNWGDNYCYWGGSTLLS